MIFLCCMLGCLIAHRELTRLIARSLNISKRELEILGL